MGETVTQLKNWLNFNPGDLPGSKWDLMYNALSGAQQHQLALKLWTAATAEEPTASGKRRRELVLVQKKPRNASELADMVAAGSVESTQWDWRTQKPPKEDLGTEWPKWRPGRLHWEVSSVLKRCRVGQMSRAAVT